jgi:hypothetical protein
MINTQEPQLAADGGGGASGTQWIFPPHSLSGRLCRIQLALSCRPDEIDRLAGLALDMDLKAGSGCYRAPTRRFFHGIFATVFTSTAKSLRP